MRHAIEEPHYTFGFDWFSDRIPQFERFLSPLKGTDCQLLEIGTHEGRAATWLMDNVAVSKGSHLTCIDIVYHPNWNKNIEATGAWRRVEFWGGRSSDVLPALPRGHYDFIYVDGDHGRVEVFEDAVLSFRLAKVGGLIAFDDYQWSGPESDPHGNPKEAIDAFLAAYKGRLDLLHSGYQVWVRKTAD